MTKSQKGNDLQETKLETEVTESQQGRSRVGNFQLRDSYVSPSCDEPICMILAPLISLPLAAQASEATLTVNSRLQFLPVLHSLLVGSS